jgi:OOP family OmpA-OmpF porin
VTPERERLLWRLLYVCGGAFFLLGIFTVWFGPNSASNLESRLQTAADRALASANLTAWSANARGAALDLEGVAASEDEMREVVRALKSATGNGDVRSDKVILAPVAKPFVWTARKENGFVTIEGVAPSRKAMVAIYDAAKRLYPSRMNDLTTLASGAPEGVDWGAAAVSGLEALRKLERGEVKLSGNELTLTGLGASDTDAQLAANWILRGEGGVKPKADVTGPPEFVATIENGAIVLYGKASSVSAQRELARAGISARSVTDKTYLASVGPWQRRAVVALSALTQFSRGEISVQGRTFRISGEAPGSVIGYLREDMAVISDGYQVDYGIAETEPHISDFEDLNLLQTGKAKADACQQAFNRVTEASRIIFASGRAEISRVSGPSLDRLVAVARACDDLDIEIRGHTDSTGRRSANLALSRQRADAVKNYLVGRGLSADRLSAVGFGPDRPVASNRSEAGRAKNRRIEFRVTRGEAL